ncbi:MAG: hypothetical protein ACYS14_12165, partial [Planctomycetota bacterium]
MEEQSVEGSEHVIPKQAEPTVPEGPKVSAKPEAVAEPKASKPNKKIILWGIPAIAVVVIVGGLAFYLVPKAREVGWFSNQMIAIYIAAGAIGGSILAGFLFRKPLRT